MKTVKVGLGTCGVSAGGEKTYEALRSLLAGHDAEIELRETGCMGMCYHEPLVEILSGGGSVTYGDMTAERVRRLVEEEILGGHPIPEWIVQGPLPTPDDEFLARQKRIVLRNCGVIDPNSIDEYIGTGGYRAIEQVLREYTPEQVVQCIIDSGLRGRGGGGFPTGIKWEICRKAAGDKKYIICNADEGDPGAFMDRSVLESDPHSVLEGMMICAFAVGAEEGFIYCRAEYPKAVRRLRHSIAAAYERGFLGNNILGTSFRFTIAVKEGAGAFVCGEETALISSIEGRRGMPRFRPPYPAESGLWGKPTNINNVETFANVPWIILNGAEAFAAMGTGKSKGTKVFALAGKIARGGLVEVPMGITINEIVREIGGGIAGGREFKAVQMGGPSGGCIPATMGETQIDYQQLNKTGAIMGSGGLVVMDETTCMVEMAKFFLKFTQDESCGKCTFCRIGTKRMLETLERITEGKGVDGDIEFLELLAEQIRTTSLCGLGQTAPNPVLTTLKYFREEYETHIRDRKCPAHSCAALVTYAIDPEKCNGCMVCLRQCPAGAIAGAKKELHTLDQSLCTLCGKCFEVCAFGAILKN